MKLDIGLSEEYREAVVTLLNALVADEFLRLKKKRR